jgi:hypothetical protein
MGKMKRDYSDVERREAGEGYSGEVPKPGIYNAVLSSVGEHTTSDTSTVWTFDITDDPYEGWRGWVYTNAEGAAWKEVQILEALGIMKPGADTVDTTHESIMKKAGPCRVRVKREKYDDEVRGKIGTILPPSGGSSGGSKKSKKDKGSDPF